MLQIAIPFMLPSVSIVLLFLLIWDMRKQPKLLIVWLTVFILAAAICIISIKWFGIWVGVICAFIPFVIILIRKK